VLRDVWITAAPYLMGHPRRPGWATVWQLAVQALRRRRHLARATRILLSAPGPLIEEWFESPELRTALACFAIGGVVSIDEPGSGIIMSVMALQHEWGVRRPVGGMGALVAALLAELGAHGGAVRCGDPVAALLHDADRVVGVVTRSGTEFRAPRVVGAIDPTTLFGQLAPAALLGERLRDEIAALSVSRNNFAACRADVALSTAPRLVTDAARARELLPSSMLFASDLDAVRRTCSAIAVGELVADLPVWIAAPSAIDRSLVPEGSPGEGLYVFVPAVPLRLRGGEPWSARRGAVADAALAAFERVAPGVSGSVIGTAVRSPEDIVASSGVFRGHAFHADMCLSQMGPWRPTPGLSGYRSPIPGLWHTGAGAHPMGTVCGWPGRAAARDVLRAG
jgi:phytoene dehydrogenase-like protein